METEKKLMVLHSDDSAAKKQTVTGWVSRTGFFFGDNEDMARYRGCTHKTCDCGSPMEKSWTKCEACRNKLDHQRFMNYPFKEWDRIEPICEYHGDKYFFNEDDIEQYLEDNDMPLEDLLLVICEPNHARRIDSSYWEDELPEDGEIPKELQAKLDELNELIKTLPPLSWSPSKVRTEYKRCVE